MATRICKTCGGELKSKRTRRGFITIHTATGAGCPSRNGEFKASSHSMRSMDADEMAEYRMTAEYAAEVRHVPMDDCNNDL